MQRGLIFVSIALLFALTLTACAPSIEERTKILYPTLPRTDCVVEPQIPSLWASDAEFAAWIESVRLAGEECRQRLNAVDVTRRGWPSQ